MASSFTITQSGYIPPVENICKFRVETAGGSMIRISTQPPVESRLLVEVEYDYHIGTQPEERQFVQIYVPKGENEILHSIRTDSGEVVYVDRIHAVVSWNPTHDSVYTSYEYVR